MTHKQIMAWAAQWNHPYLRIGDEASPPTPDVLRHGKEHYEALRHDVKRRKLTSLRIERWQARFTRVQVSDAIERVDALKKHSTKVVQMEEERIEV